MKNNSNSIITVLLLIIVGGAAFFGGIKYQQSKTPAGGQFAFRGNGAQGGRFSLQGGQNRAGARGFGGATFGKVDAIDANSITLKLQDGSSKIINISSTKTFNKTDSAAKTDVKTGDTVAAIGTSNSDGSITAQSIQLNPMVRNDRQGTPLTAPTK
jgi:Cu/Ag efflux protein CusF